MPSERRRRSRSPRERRSDKARRGPDKGAASAAKLDRKRKKDEDTSEQQPASPPAFPVPLCPPWRKEGRCRKERREEGEAGDEDAGAESGGGEIALGVEDMNKLREKLGMAPLEESGGTTIVDSETGLARPALRSRELGGLG